MQVKVKYFASLRDYIGRDEEFVELNDGMSVFNLWRQIIGDRKTLVDIMVSVNMEYVKFDTVLRDGDEVAFFPPVTGG